MITKNEYGKTIYVNVGMDISTASETEILFTKPDGTTLSKLIADGVDIGIVPVSADCSVFAANEYIKYVTVDGDIDQSGSWNVRAIITIGSQKFVGRQTVMKVGA